MRAKVAKFLCAGVAASALAGASPALAGACKLGVLANLPVTMDGLRASVPVKVNGRQTSFWLDSGAFFNAMSKAKATELGLPLKAAPEGFYIVGLGGSASIQVATIKSFGIAGQALKNIQFIVGGSDVGNGLIGRNLLAIKDTDFDLAHGSVKLVDPEGCGDMPLAYWTKGKPYFIAKLEDGPNPRDHEFLLPVSINGTGIKAELDTGATTLLSRHAAEKAGIDLSGPGVLPLSDLHGLGRHSLKGWIVPVANVTIGEEQILETHLAVVDGSIGGSDGPDMLLGADYALAHHIYVARGQHRIYFTYSGGPVFAASSEAREAGGDAAAKAVALPEGTQRVAALQTAAEPKDAAEFERRGNVRLTQRDPAGAIADFSRAIELAPAKGDYYGDRAKAYLASGKEDLALADMKAALKLDPGNAELLQTRAAMRLADHDEAGALADVEAAERATAPSSLDMATVAALYGELGMADRAVALFNGVIAVHHEDASLGTLLNGRCWERALANVDLEDALDDCDHAIKHYGAKPQFLDSRGLVHFRMGDYAAAIADYDAALAKAPDIAWSLYVRGLAKIATGKVKQGEADKAAALKIAPDVEKQANRYGIGVAKEEAKERVKGGG